MATAFIEELHQFALAIDIVNDAILKDVGIKLKEYFRNVLRVQTFEIRMFAPPSPEGERYLRTLWNSEDREFTTPLCKNGRLRGHTEYAVKNSCRLWIVPDGGEHLSPDGKYRNLLVSGPVDLPPYRSWPRGRKFVTSIIMPIGQPALGYLNLEKEERVTPFPEALEELQRVVDCIEIFYRLSQSHAIQVDNTDRAIRNLKVPEQPRRCPLEPVVLFFAYSGQADAKVIEIINEVLKTFKRRLRIIDWNEMKASGNVNAQINTAIRNARFGICYLSEPDRDAGHYRDNPNVLFEAGMFHALHTDSVGQSRWIPIREANSDPIPFDFAAERILEVPRTDGKIDEKELRTNLEGRIEKLLTVNG